MTKTIQAAIFLVLLFIGSICAREQESPHSTVPLPCKDCHIEKNWSMIHFNHSDTKFPLSGAHHAVKCRNCHQLTDFATSGMFCSDCHLDIHRDWLGQDCAQCHSPANWLAINIQKVHANTPFAFIGGHAGLDCNVCHNGGFESEFMNLQSDCISCHQAEYQQTQDPDHSSFNFSHRCNICHSLISWIPADYADHESYFPIYSGSHSGEWDQCSTCHYVKDDYSEFSCYLNCHEHSRAGTDARHNGVRNYRYESHACYNCHPSGGGGD